MAAAKLRGPDESLPVKGESRVTLKALADHLQLSKATVSLVLNRAPGARSIPERTHRRIFEAARELNYRPNFVARSLRRKRTQSIGVVVPDIGDAYAAGIISGIEEQLLAESYFSFVACHRSRSQLRDQYLALLTDRLVEGFILIATSLQEAPSLPTVAVAGHRRLKGVTNVVLDHDAAARAALSHLAELGHRDVAFFRGHPESADSEDRWAAIADTAADMGLEVRPELTLEFTTPDVTYAESYAFGRTLLARSALSSGGGPTFTALFAFDDVSATGAMRAFLDAGLRVPEDVSVVGFDDIQGSAFQNPSLTTVRQPLREMGQLAGRTILEILAGDAPDEDFLTVAPRLVVRSSTGPAKPRPRSTARRARNRRGA